jgi:hypothetical protein
MLSRKPLASLLFLPLGAASAILGLLPWLITGLRLPLQNLWATAALPADMPIVLLPFSQYSAVLLVAVLWIGAAIAGIVGRAVPARHRLSAWVALEGGVLLVQVIAIVQTAVTVSRGLRVGPDSTSYLGALVGLSIGGMLLGVAVTALIARAPKGGALFGMASAAIAVGPWLSGLVFPINAVVSASPLTSALGEVVRFAPAVAIGAGIAWCGIRTVGRVIAAIVSLVLLWVGPTVITAVSAALGSRVLAHYPREMLDYAVQVFRSALVMPELWAPVVGLAIAIAAVGIVGMRTVRRRAVPVA